MEQSAEHFGDFEFDQSLDESDFRQGLALITERVRLAESQRYGALQDFVRWGLAGNRPDLALEAYNAYVIYGWTWHRRTNIELMNESNDRTDDYYIARDAKEEETGESHDGMSYFSLFDLTYYGAIDGRVQMNEKEDEGFRNDVLPQIISGLLTSGKVQKAHEFLQTRRAIHNFRGYPRELEPEQCVDVHVLTAQALLDTSNELVFDGDPEEAFNDLANFALEHAQFPQFGSIDIVPKLAPIRKAMIDRGLSDPWEVFLSGLDDIVRRFNDGMFGVDALFSGIRSYLAAAQAGEVQDLRSVKNWPPHAIEAFDMVERNASIPDRLAWLIPAVRGGEMGTSASENFRSAPTLGKNILLAAVGDKEALEAIKSQQKETTNALPQGELSLEEALKINTRAY